MTEIRKARETEKKEKRRKLFPIRRGFEVRHLTPTLSSFLICFSPDNPHPVCDHLLPLPRAKDCAEREKIFARLDLF